MSQNHDLEEIRPPRFRDLPPVVTWEHQGRAWRVACNLCVQEIVVPDLDSVRLKEFLRRHTHRKGTK